MVRAKLTCATALGFALALAATGCEAHSRVANAVHASPLSVVSATTPRFPVARFETGGTFPQVRDGKLALGAVNMALRAVVASDQRAFEPRARGVTASGSRAIVCPPGTPVTTKRGSTGRSFPRAPSS